MSLLASKPGMWLSRKLHHTSRTARTFLFRASLPFIVLVSVPLAWAQDQKDRPEADPARPTVSNPAHIPPVGYLQLEQGILIAADSPVDANSRLDHQTSIVQATKLSANKRLLFTVLSQPYAQTTSDDSTRSSDAGDVQVSAQAVLLDSNHGHATIPSLSASYTRRIHAGTATSLDTGETSQGVALLASGNVRQLHYDANLFLNEQNDFRGARRAQHGQALLLSYNPTKKLSLSGEIWHFTQPFVRGDAVGNLWAAAYSLQPNLVFDAGFNHGLTSTSTQWTGFGGFTYLLPHRLWH